MNSNKTTARIAGLLFLMVVVCGAFAEFFVRRKIIVPDDYVKTANNIMINQRLFQLGILSDLMMSVAFLFFAITLYFLFKPVNTKQARVMVLCVVIAVPILCINTLNQVAASLLMSGDNYLDVFDKQQLQGMVTFFLRLHSKGYMIGQIFYGLYLFPLGYLVYKSGFFPKIIGVLLMLGCIGDLIEVFRFFLFPTYESVILQNISVPADIGEISLCLWLLIKGIKNQPPSVLGRQLSEENKFIKETSKTLDIGWLWMSPQHY